MNVKLPGAATERCLASSNGCKCIEIYHRTLPRTELQTFPLSPHLSRNSQLYRVKQTPSEQISFARFIYWHGIPANLLLFFSNAPASGILKFTTIVYRSKVWSFFHLISIAIYSAEATPASLDVMTSKRCSINWLLLKSFPKVFLYLFAHKYCFIFAR